MKNKAGCGAQPCLSVSNLHVRYQPMIAILGIVLVLGIVFGPMAWTKWVMRRHAVDRPDFPGTGGELARHILDAGNLEGVPVEVTELGDHYDPQAKAVRLSKANFEGRSVTAVAVAAHEVGHALQDRDGYQPLVVRTRLAVVAHRCQQIAQFVIVAAPLMLMTSPRLALVQVAAGLLIMGGRVIVTIVTLPVEYDASFKRALPILIGGQYLRGADIAGATSVLRAAAFTYVAAALASLLNVLRWFRFGR